MDRVQRRARKNRRKKIRLVLAIFIVIMAIVGTTFMLLIKPIFDNSYESIISIKNTEKITGFSLKDDKLIIGFNDRYNIISGGAISTYDFNKTYDDMELYSLDKNVVMIDKATGELMLINSLGEVIQKKSLDSEIISIKIDEANNIGMHVSENNIHKIVIYDSKLERSKEIEMKKDITIIEYIFNVKKNIMVISTVSYVDDIKTSINIMDIEGSKKRVVDLDGEITTNMYIDDNSEIMAISDKKVFKMSLKGEVVWEREVDISKIEYNDFNNTLLIAQFQQGVTNIFLLNRDNKIVFESQLKFKVEGIVSKADKVILYGDKYICEIRNNRIKTTKMYNSIRKLGVLDNNQLFVENEKKIVVVKPFL